MVHTFTTGPSCSTTGSNRTVTEPLSLTPLSDRRQPLSGRCSDNDAPDKRSRCRRRRQHVRFAASRINMASVGAQCWRNKVDPPRQRRRGPRRSLGLRALEESLTSIKQRNPERSTRPREQTDHPATGLPGSPECHLANEPQPAKSLFIGRGRWEERRHGGTSR